MCTHSRAHHEHRDALGCLALGPAVLSAWCPAETLIFLLGIWEPSSPLVLPLLMWPEGTADSSRSQPQGCAERCKGSCSLEHKPTSTVSGQGWPGYGSEGPPCAVVQSWAGVQGPWPVLHPSHRDRLRVPPPLPALPRGRRLTLQP